MKKVVRISWTFALATVLLALGSSVQAALIARGDALVYDDELNITWTKNADLSKTERFGLTEGILDNGRMDWNTARSWVSVSIISAVPCPIYWRGQ